MITRDRRFVTTRPPSTTHLVRRRTITTMTKTYLMSGLIEKVTYSHLQIFLQP